MNAIGNDWNSDTTTGRPRNCVDAIASVKQGETPASERQMVPAPVYRIGRMKGWFDQDGNLTRKWADDFGMAVEKACDMMDGISCMVEST